ncbi:protein of unknown function [Catalinimonas alkaloidigena]|uniref:DUF4421 domain-containing protein n=1 Tax=Catalinimonas alkaloidigena TaxID=1075417 RepID=A0A1G9FDF6_9BACT|nr:protein of unknown function [Catalinimonas alkaloidigena]
MSHLFFRVLRSIAATPELWGRAWCWCVVLCSLIPFASGAQGIEPTFEGDEQPPQYDTTYIKRYASQLIFKFGGAYRANALQVIDRTQGNRYGYTTQPLWKNVLGVRYEWLGLLLVYNPYFVGSTLIAPHRSRTFDLQANSYGRWYFANLYHQRYRGYRLQQPHRLMDPAPAPLPYPLRDDMRIRAYGGNAYYTFNHQRFSNRAAFTHSERQRKSAGAPLAGIFVLYTQFEADSGLVTPAFQPSFSADANLERGEFLQAGVALGYAYTWVWRQWFATWSMTLHPGTGYSKIWLAGQPSPQESTPINLSGGARFAVGYNTDRAYLGVWAIFNYHPVSYTPQQQLRFQSTNVQFGYVRRVEMPETLYRRIRVPNPFKKGERLF